MRVRLKGSRRWLAGVAALVVVAAAVGTWLVVRPGASSAAVQTITATATVGTVRQTVSTTGTLAPAHEADLDFTVSGTVSTVPVSVGDKVTKGTVLATVENPDLRSAVDLAEAGVGAAQAAVDSATGSSTQLASANAQLVAARSSLAQAKAQLVAATLTAPFAGTVASVDLAPGDVVGSSGSGGGNGGSGGSGSSGSSTATSQVVLISTDAWVVDASVGAADLASVKKGLQVEVTPDGTTERVFGTVSSVGIVAQSGSTGAASFPVSIAVTGSPTGLYAGGTVTAQIVVRQLTDVLTVPTAAISSQNGATTVSKLVNGKQVSTPVVVGTVLGASTQVTSGLKEGDQVVVRQFRLPSGTNTGNGGQRGQFGRGGFGGTGGGFGGGGFRGGGFGGTGGGGAATGGRG